MPGGAKRPTVLLDTSTAVALIVSDHVAHELVLDSLTGRKLGLAGHAYFETYSVLTRLPGSARRSPADVSKLLSHNFPDSRFLDDEATAALTGRLPAMGIAGGAVYDALVGAAARYHGLSLATRDERALNTYQVLDVDVIVVR